MHGAGFMIGMFFAIGGSCKLSIIRSMPAFDVVYAEMDARMKEWM